MKYEIAYNIYITYLGTTSDYDLLFLKSIFTFIFLAGGGGSSDEMSFFVFPISARTEDAWLRLFWVGEFSSPERDFWLASSIRVLSAAAPSEWVGHFAPGGGQPGAKNLNLVGFWGKPCGVTVF